MRLVTLAQADDWPGWRDAARSLASANVPAGDIVWEVGASGTDLFARQDGSLGVTGPAFSVPRKFIDLAQSVICHSEPQRFALLYNLLLRVKSRPRLLEEKSDPAVHKLERMARAVRRDSHKMHAFVRFREIGDGAARRYVAWFEPDHHIVRANAGFFARRFATMAWSILTPELSLHWDGERLAEAPGARRCDAPDGDPLELLWRSYYASIFNPARIKTAAMLKEMPKKYWRNMPETALIAELLAKAPAREQAMVAASQGQARF